VHRGEQADECLGLLCDPQRASRPQEADQPGEGSRHVMPAKRQRPVRVTQPSRDLAQHALTGERHDRRWAEASCIAERGVPSGQLRVDHRDTVAVALQPARRCNAISREWVEANRATTLERWNQWLSS